ncbi:MAG: hypothetical protein FJW30_11760 [Acidobacteria bacterium]|nr:hypothetical protein [Acidobacteriota bacterium]
MLFRGVLPVVILCLFGAASIWSQACTSVTLNNSGAFAAVGGGNGTFNVSGNPTNCLKSASSQVPWITISFGGGASNPSTFGYTVQANTATSERVGAILVNGGLATFTVTQAGIACSYNLSPGSATVSSAGGSGTFNVSGNEACSWNAATATPWISITAGSGTGNGSVSYSVQPNTSTDARTGTITVGNSTFTVNQQPACSFTLVPSFQQIRASGESGSVAITANVSSCERLAVSDSPWLTIPVGSSGTGNGTLSWTAAANNTSSVRTGRITVGNATFSVQQEGGACSYSLNPASVDVTAGNVAGNFTVTTTCAWTAQSSAAWLTINGASTGSGTSTIGYVTAANPLPAARTASITVGTAVFRVNQEGTPCSLNLSGTGLELTSAGGSGAFEVDVVSGCSWTASSNVPWITFTSASSGNSDATVTFMVGVNSTPGTRTGTITVGNRQFVVTQTGANCELTVAPTSNLAVPSNAFQGSITVNSTCQWTAQSTAGFITIVTGASGNGNGRIDYSIGANPSAQSRSGSIRIGNLVFAITQAGGGCSISLNPASTTLGGGAVTGSFSVNGSIGCQWTPSAVEDWITVTAFSSVNGSGAVDFELKPNFSGATRTGTVRVNDQSFAITQTQGRPAIIANGILNAASFRGGPVAPGEIITIYGTLMGPESIRTLELTPDRTGIRSVLGETRVLFDGFAGPMIYTTDRQLSVIVPFEVAGRQTTKVRVEYLGAQSEEVDAPVAPTAPAIFTQNASGTGPGAILNQDNSLNTAANSATRNSIVQIFATGGGLTIPAGQTGQLTGTPLPVFPPGRITVRIANLDAPIVYAGGAPGLVQGLNQINVRIPANAPVGGSVPIVLRANNVDSPAGVTIAIR